jgi:hypothetical protein
MALHSLGSSSDLDQGVAMYRYRMVRLWLLALIALALPIIVVLYIFLFPGWIVSKDIDSTAMAQLKPVEVLQARNEARKTVLQTLQVVGGLWIVVSVYLTWRQTQLERMQAQQQSEMDHHQMQLDRSKEVAERFSQAVEQLGSEKSAVRLGSIYALERIAAYSVDDRAATAEVLSAYIHEHAPWQDGTTSNARPAIDDLPPLTVRSPEAQAVLNVLAKQSWSDQRENQLRLNNLDLRRADLRNAYLRGADLHSTHLDGADLTDAHLEETDLRGARLEGTRLAGARLDAARVDRTTVLPKDFDAENAAFVVT